jgi:predicted metalloprotease with PDZ domain
LLWVSEGITVYYEYMILKRAGLITKSNLFRLFQSSIEAYENNPGHLYQSLTQASYETWSDGPFGNSGNKVGKTISYYDKGPTIGLLLDFDIRNATNNNKSLDDVMRLLYKQYYLQKKRGFSDAEFQQACETVADTSLSDVFGYVNTVKDINYNKYLAYAGLNISVTQVNSTNTTDETARRSFNIFPVNNASKLETTILKSWAGE